MKTSAIDLTGHYERLNFNSGVLAAVAKNSVNGVKTCLYLIGTKRDRSCVDIERNREISIYPGLGFRLMDRLQ